MCAESSHKADMRRGYAEAVLQLIQEDQRYIVVVADSRLSPHLGTFARLHPARFVDVGVAQQNLFGSAVGLAEAGWIPLVSGICNLVVMRPFEQIRTLVGHRNLNIKIAAMASGLSYPLLGASHNAVEDIALMRSIPELVVVCPADANQGKAVTIAAARHIGPAYIRFGAHQERELFPATVSYRLGESVIFGEGRAVALVTTGPSLATCLDVAQQLEDLQCPATVIDIPTIKPLAEDTLLWLVRNFELVCTVEEHSVIGGLGSAICEYMGGQASHPRVIRLGVPDKLPITGSRSDVLDAFGLSANGIASACARELRRATYA
jgi:transketolase